MVERGTEDVRCCCNHRVRQLNLRQLICVYAYLGYSNSACQASAQRCLFVAGGGCALATILAEDLLSELLILALATTLKKA